MNNILILILITLIFMGCIKPEKELYILPNNFKGTVAVIFNIKDGAPKEYLNGYRVYRIPENGVLFTQFSNNTGEFAIDDIQYKYVYGNDTLRIKEYDIGTKDTTSSSAQIFSIQSGMLGNKKFEYRSFIVCSYIEWIDTYKGYPGFIDEDPSIRDIIKQRLQSAP